jgi:chemotaxis protein histidine kinase CheA
MAMTDLSTRIEDLASLLVVADPRDAGALEEILQHLEGLEGTVDAVAQPLLRGCVAALRRCSDDGGAADEALERLEELIDLLRASQAPEADADSVMLGELALPALVDEELVRDFLGAQVHGLEELERRILRLEQDGTEQATLKRQIHTIKGEAGMLGLRDLAGVCHAAEDLLAVQPPVPGLSDLLLEVKDWIEAAVASYADWKLPQSAAALLERLISGAADQPAGDLTDGEPAEHAAEQPTDPLAQTVEQATAAEPPMKPAQTSSAEAGEQPQSEAVERDEEDLVLIGEFLQESEEGLASVDQLLLDGERDGLDAEKVNGIFRVFHTIKGVAGFLEFEQITDVAHCTETMLDRVRSGKLAVSSTVFDLVFDATSKMRQLLSDVDRAVEEGVGLALLSGLDELLTQLKAVTEGKPLVAGPLPAVEENEKLGEILMREGVVDKEGLQQALTQQVDTGRKLGQELVASGQAPAKTVAKALRAQAKRGAEGRASARR